MIRNTFFAALGITVLATSVQAAVMINSVKGTTALAGHSLYTLTAVSDEASGPILGFDFAGDPDNDNPETGLGFYGPMSQVNPFGSFATIFQDNNALFPNTNPVRMVNEDSQFLVATTTPGVVVPSGFGKESASLLKGTWAYADPQGLSVAFAQLVIPDAASAAVNFRGTVLAGPSGAGENFAVNGCVGTCGTPGVAPLVADVAGQTNALGDIINLTPVDSVPGTPPVTWSALGGPTYTPGFGAPGDAPGLGGATWSWNPATQAFQFNTLGSTRGTYVWTGTASNDAGSDPFSITVDVRHVPEPATLALVGLALVGFVGVARKRS